MARSGQFRLIGPGACRRAATPARLSTCREADSTTVVNLRAGYRFNNQLALTLGVFNLLGSRDPDISYFYESCLPSDPPEDCGAGLSERPGVSDIHLHPVEPRALRATLRYEF